MSLTLPTGTVTFAFSDIEGSTQRWERHPNEMQTALRRHDALLREAIESNNGHVFKTVGDAFCAAFSTAMDGLAAALAAQRAIAAQDWSAVEGLRIRMALHAGNADERDGDYFGPTVNRVARLMGAAHGGQVIASRVVADLAQTQLPSGISLRDLGTHRLRDLASAEQIFQLVAPDLPSDFPPLRSLDTHPTNLPVQLTAFIGREAEIAEIVELSHQSRLVTLVGAGGIGKTRTALQVGAELLVEFVDGAWFVELAPLDNPSLVPSAIAAVFNVEDRGGDRPLIELVALALKSKRALLVLDNCEHLVTAAADAVDHLLKACPNLRVIATSREPLGIFGEAPYRMPSLSEDEGVELFVTRAQAAQRTFTLTEATEPIVRDIVRRLDGIALAIELAAPRIKLLSVDQISKRLDERFKLLTGGSRTALPRQQTLRALIEWSYELLSEAEKSLLQQVAIFRGGWTLDAAIEVCGGGSDADWDVIELLSELVDKSLAVADVEGDEQRYRLLESTRQYALERLKENGELDALADRHCAYYARVADNASDALWKTNLQPWFAAIRSELENYRAAIDWTLIQRHNVPCGAAIVAAIDPLWVDALRREGSALVDRSLSELSASSSPQIHARLLIALAHLAVDSGRSVEAGERAIPILRQSGESAALADALRILGNSLARAGRTPEALSHFEEGLAIARKLQLPRLVAVILSDMGVWVMAGGDSARAQQLLEESSALIRSHDDRRRIATVLAVLAEVRFIEGDVLGALAGAKDAEEIAKDVGHEYLTMLVALNAAAYSLALDKLADAWSFAREAARLAVQRELVLVEAFAIEHLAQIAARTGDEERAARLVGYVDAAYAREQSVRALTERFGYERTMAKLNESLPHERLSELLAIGGKMEASVALDEAMDIAHPDEPAIAEAV